MDQSNAKMPIAIITGASAGIGKAVAAAFAADGYMVLICSRSMEHLEAAAKEIRDQYPAAIIKVKVADFSKKEDILDFADWCLAQGMPEILVNNAGIYLPGNLSNEAEGNMEQVMNVNFYSAYYLTRKLLPPMIQAGKGHIFNMGSIAGLNAYEGGGSYSVSKFALHGFSKNLRYELKTSAIKVTHISAGAVMTGSWEGFDNSHHRIMESSDVAALILACSKLSPQAVVEDIVLRPQLGDL
jgi:short-subunit dehydrogenase